MKIDLYKLEKEAEDAQKQRELELEEQSKQQLLSLFTSNQREAKRLYRRGKIRAQDKQYFPNANRKQWFKRAKSIEVRN